VIVPYVAVAGPTDITLTPDTIGLGAIVVGTLSTTGGTAPYTYSIVP